MSTKHRFLFAIGVGLLSGIVVSEMKAMIYVTLYVALFLSIIHYFNKKLNKKIRSNYEIVNLKGVISSCNVVAILSPEYNLNRTQYRYEGAKYYYYDSVDLVSNEGELYKVLVGLNSKREVLLDYTQSLEFGSLDFQNQNELNIQVILFDDEYYCEKELFMKLKGIDF